MPRRVGPRERRLAADLSAQGGVSPRARSSTNRYTVPLARRQLCWAPRRCGWVAFAERGGTAWRAKPAPLAETRAIFAL